MEEFELLDYNEDNLAFSLSNKLIKPNQIKIRKVHYRYLLNYLDSPPDGIGARKILIEKDYISKDYLLDYSYYLALCFYPYKKQCKRVHFFGNTFTKDDFIKSLLNPTDSKAEEIWNSYLGCIAVKPLPETVIGITLLRTYPETDAAGKTNVRRFPACREYEIHLYGKAVSINTLAFQEQDQVLSACATTAVWTTFHKIAEMFHTFLPTPGQITEAAGNLYFTVGRSFPTRGLDIGQICRSIESIHLVSELRTPDKTKNNEWFRAFIYAYNKMGLPVLLGIEFENGAHLITIVGYEEKQVANEDPESKSNPGLKNSEISLYSGNINKFYTHDDQVGPFARIKFLDDEKIETAWWTDHGEKSLRKAKIACVIVPVYQKIRITFEDVFTKIRLINLFFSHLGIFENIVRWDIHLDQSNSYKTEILKNPLLDEKNRKSLILASMPRFVWKARLLSDNRTKLEFVFDATDISSGFFCHRLIIYDQSLRENLAQVFSHEDAKNLVSQKLGHDYLELFLSEL